MDKGIKEYIITSSKASDQSACLWDYNTSNVLKVFRNGGILASKCLEIVGQDYIIGCELEKPVLHVWALNNQDSKKKRIILPASTTCLAVCPKSFYLVGGINCKIYIWQLTSGKLLCVLQKNYQQVTRIKFSSDGDYLLVTGQDGILSVYNFVELINLSNSFLTQTDIGQVEPIYVKHDHSMSITDLHVGSFGRKSRFATVSSDQTCRLYNLSDGEPILTLVFSEPLTVVTFDAPCWQLFIGDIKGNINQLVLKDSKFSHHVSSRDCLRYTGHTSKISCITINMTNTLLASTSEANNTVYIWDIKSRQVIKRIEHKACITNIKFVSAYQNFFVEKFAPSVVLKNLERNTFVSNLRSSVCISQIQRKDINSLIDKCNSTKQDYLHILMNENVKLRCINKQLFSAALEISKKCD